MTHAPLTANAAARESAARHAVGLSRKLIRALARTDARARKLACLLALRRIHAVSSDVDLALDAARVVTDLHLRAVRLPSALGSPVAVGTRTTDLAQGLAYASESFRHLALQLARVDPRGSLRATGIARSCDDATVLLRHLVTTLHHPERASAALAAGKRVSLSARWLIDSAVRALPPADRPRYAEEWHSELWDLSAEPRRRHLAHALRVTLHARSTRRAISNARRHDGGEEW
ncbi:hypothetical protein [Streptomyces sp. NPDC088812]|uniref:hypothetical protein n=1 Tax=Streptomyces sp. NPDC088812 TaxID=3365905 RepID=UPI0038212CD8